MFEGVGIAAEAMSRTRTTYTQPKRLAPVLLYVFVFSSYKTPKLEPLCPCTC